MSQLPNDRMQAMRNLRQVIKDYLPEGFTESNKTAFYQYLQPMKLICGKKIMLLLSLILSGLIQINAQILRPIGTNLSGIQDWSSEYVFVDVFNQCREWIPHEYGSGAPWSSGVAVPLGPEG